MNTLQKTTLAIIGVWSIAATTFAFADSDASSTGSVNPPMSGYGKMHQKGGMENGFLQKFLRTDLTDTDKTTLSTLEQNHRDAMKALFANTQSGSVNSADFQAQAKALQDQYMTNLLPYIATDKQDAFKQFFASMPQGHMGAPHMDNNKDEGKGGDDDRREGWRTQNGSVMGMNEKNRGKMPQMGVLIQKSALLPASVYTAVDAKLASLSTTDAKLAWLNGVNQKIDAVAAKVTSQKSKDILAALKDLLNQKIDALNNNGVDSSTLNDLLQ